MIFDHSTTLGVALFLGALHYLVFGEVDNAAAYVCGAIVATYGFDIARSFWRARTGV